MSVIAEDSIDINDAPKIADSANKIAQKANGGVVDINDPNTMTPSEKVVLKQRYESDLGNYNIDVLQLKAVGLPTDVIDSAMSNLTDFLVPFFNNMSISEPVDRDKLNKFLSDFETADKNSEKAFTDFINGKADEAAKAGDDAKVAGDNAQKMGAEAKASAEQAKTDATQAKADATTAQQKAQSSIDQLNAHLPDIDTALSTANLVKQDVTKLSDTTEQYHNEYTTGIQNVISTVNNMTISNRNLALGTATPITTAGTNTSKQFTSDYGFSSVIPKGTVVTVTFDIASSTGAGMYTMQFNGYDDGGSWQTISTGSLVNGTKRVSATLTTDSDHLHVHSRLDNATGTVTISNFIISESSKEVSWSPAPEDLATNTEFDQLNNAIKLKADSRDVTSQITVATQGIQSEVNNKVSGLNTKISQTDSAWRASVSAIGTTNMVYNGGFAHGVDGWNTNNDKWIWSNQVQDQVQGNNAIQAYYADLTNDAWNHIESKPFLVRSGQQMSIGAIVTPFALDSDSSKGFGIMLEFFASNDGTGPRLENYHPEHWKYTAGREQLKVENITVPDGANSAKVALYIQRNGGSNFTCVQANMVPTLPPFIDGFATATDITASLNNIHMGFQNPDGSQYQFNMNSDGNFVMDMKNLYLNGNTNIMNGTIGNAQIADGSINNAKIANASVDNAKIADLSVDNAKIKEIDGSKIFANSIGANQINVTDLIARGINGQTITGTTINGSNINSPNIVLGNGSGGLGQISTPYSNTDDISNFQPTTGGGFFQIQNGQVFSRASGMYYNKLTADKTGWGYWDSQGFHTTGTNAKPPYGGTSNVSESVLNPMFLKLDIWDEARSAVQRRAYIDGTGIFINDGGTNSVDSYLMKDGFRVNHDELVVGSFSGTRALRSSAAYHRTYSYGANMFITANNVIGRSTSASKYKYNIKPASDEAELGQRLLNLHMSTWNDKSAVDNFAKELSTGVKDEDPQSIKEMYGLIAEDLDKAGLGMFVQYGSDGQIEGIQYDRAWIPLIGLVKDLTNKVNRLEEKVGISA
ncbi:cell envelope integrity protein TolA [Pediococcus argentinicus]|uniref:cell envelope integrity protein TolA n=1 Tax=Pediococcus argentinicus TaxID=480391 RepID=UPI00338DD43C